MPLKNLVPGISDSEKAEARERFTVSAERLEEIKNLKKISKGDKNLSPTL